LSIYRLRKIWFEVAAMALATSAASLPPKQPSIRQRSAKNEAKSTSQKKPKASAANSQTLEVARRL
jgi:hypothetical protein